MNSQYFKIVCLSILSWPLLVSGAQAAIYACSDDQAARCALETGRATNDPQFMPENIAEGVNILGVTGSLLSSVYPPSYPYAGPSGCSSIGDLYADGTVYAGYHPTLLVPLYIPVTDQGTTSQWKTSKGQNDIAIDSIDDGRINSNQVANSATFPAFKRCKDLTAGGHHDWYLPSQVELFYLWAARAQIQAKGNITNFQSAIYWSSTEYDANPAWIQDFINSAHYNGEKTTAYRVRCVRR